MSEDDHGELKSAFALDCVCRSLTHRAKRKERELERRRPGKGTMPLTLASHEIYNQRAISRRQALNGRSPIETLFEMTGEDFH